MLIGITGKSGSGKSTLATYLSEILHIPLIDMDKIAHEELTLERFNEVLSWIDITPMNSVDRKYLASLLYHNEELNKRYNCYIYPFMQKNLEEKMTESSSNQFIIDWNYLPITPLFSNCEVKILVECNFEERAKRVMKRDCISYDLFLSRDKSGIEYDNFEYDIICKMEEKERILEYIKERKRNNL